MKRMRLSERNQRNLKRFLHNKLAVIGLVVVMIMLIGCLIVPLITPYGADEINFSAKVEPPSAAHPFGTDKLGRDVFTRAWTGGRTSILIAVSSALASAALGMVLGSISGYFGGKVDAVLLRISEVFSTFPQLVLVLVFISIVGAGLWNVVLVFVMTGWMVIYRIVRGEFLVLREETFVKACETFGMRKSSIMLREILPNILTPVVVASTADLAGYILQEAGLSFLGLGVPITTPSWGNILNAARSVEVVINYWWMWLIPGGMIFLFVLAINFFGDGLRDVVDVKKQS